MNHFKDLPARLQALLERKGISQRELHKRSGVSTSRINEYVNGKGSPPTLPTLNRLLDALGASRNDLFSDEPIPEQPSARAARTMAERLAALEEQASFFEAELGRLQLEFAKLRQRRQEESTAGGQDDATTAV